jgi:Ca2+-binding RTX toxin-like protein
VTSVGSSDHCVECPQNSIIREFEVTVKQVVRSLSTWMQTLIPTSVGKPTRRKGSVRLKTNASECLELRALPAALIGVDFGPANGSPKNWKNFGGSTNGTVAKLTDESGVVSNVSLDIKYADGQGGGVNPTFAASQLPKHSQSLAGLNGAIRDDSKITLTFNNLTPSGVYEVYVFGGSTQADTQYITLAGSGQSQTFSQILDPSKLVVNSLAGSSIKDMSAYAKKVTATAGGQITISAEGVELPECSLAGIAIRPVLPVVPDIQMNSVKSNGESTLTVQYTIKNAAAKPFRIAAYASDDTLFSAATDKLAGYVQISNAADLTPGLHTKVYQVGQQFKLPLAATNVIPTGSLIFVADDNKLVPEDDKDPFNEDNKSVFSGAYVSGSTLIIFGSSGADKFTFSSTGQTFNVSSAVVSRSYTSSKITRIRVMAGDGVDQVLATNLTVPISAYGGAGNDRLVGGRNNDSLSGDDGNDTLEGGAGVDSLHGRDGNDSLVGGAGHDWLFGDVGDDRLIGGEGNDHSVGGPGTDVYAFGMASSPEQDTVDEQAEPGVDTLDFSTLAASTPIKVDLESKTLGTLTIATHTNRTVKIGSIRLLINFENVVGSPGDDSILGNDAANRLEGLGGNDKVSGDAGNDALSGGAGNDVLDGADGNDQMFGDVGIDSLNGGDGNDSLDGGDGDDYLDGNSGDDVLRGNGGRDLLGGYLGNDSLNGGEGDDDLRGGEGNDTLEGGDGTDTLEGWDGNDTLRGDAGNDKVSGDAGNDVLSGGAGNDVLDGADGNDQMFGDVGIDSLNGGDGNDSLDGGDGDDYLDGNSGDDVLRGNGGRDLLGGYLGNDSLNGGEGDDDLRGGEGNDTLEGGDGTDTLEGWDGNDTLRGDAGNDKVSGDAGNDVLSGGAGNDVLDGADGNDQMFGDVGIDSLNGGDGNDSLDGGDGDDYLDGFTGDDVLIGNGGRDLLGGYLGNDSLSGGAGDDDLRGGEGNDTLEGGDGNDTLEGWNGNDILVGGTGADILDGGNGEDILISGTATAFDTKAGRLALIQEWSSSKTRLQRVTLIRSGVGTPKVTLKSKVDVKNDGSKDVLKKGGTGVDWVFYRAVDDTFTSGAGDILELL